MEKLIELLNEREVGEEGGELYYLSNGIIRDDGGNILYSYRIISKEFGFIQWLVENDKIETNNLSLKAFKNIFSGGGFVEVSDLEVLLMLLSISDTPIEDLISYLK